MVSESDYEDKTLEEMTDEEINHLFLGWTYEPAIEEDTQQKEN